MMLKIAPEEDLAWRCHNSRKPKSILFTMVMELTLSISFGVPLGLRPKTFKKIYAVSFFQSRVKLTTTTKPCSSAEEEKLLKMSESQQKLSQIDDWATYFDSNKDRLKKLDTKKYASAFNIQSYEIKPELNKKVSLWKGDITKLEVDAIVNAANNSLLGGGGEGELFKRIKKKYDYVHFIDVDGAIHRSAGRELLEECKTLNGCETGNAKVTSGYKLPAKYVIHTVGPQGEKPRLLESCYKTCFQRVIEKNISSVAFPCISTGIYGYPQDSAASIALKCARNFLEINSSKIERVIFCLFLDKDVEIYETMMQLFFPVD